MVNIIIPNSFYHIQYTRWNTFYSINGLICPCLWLVQPKERKGPLFTLGNRILLKASFQTGRAAHIIIVTGPPTVPGQDLNPGRLSLEESSLLSELTRPEADFHWLKYLLFSE